jgi:hypothetical protein
MLGFDRDRGIADQKENVAAGDHSGSVTGFAASIGQLPV